MAISEQAGFSGRGGAALSTDLGQALAAQLTRLVSRFRATTQSNDMLSSTTFEQLAPDLAREIGASRRA